MTQPVRHPLDSSGIKFGLLVAFALCVVVSAARADAPQPVDWTSPVVDSLLVLSEYGDKAASSRLLSHASSWPLHDRMDLMKALVRCGVTGIPKKILEMIPEVSEGSEKTELAKLYMRYRAKGLYSPEGIELPDNRMRPEEVDALLKAFGGPEDIPWICMIFGGQYPVRMPEAIAQIVVQLYRVVADPRLHDSLTSTLALQGYLPAQHAAIDRYLQQIEEGTERRLALNRLKLSHISDLHLARRYLGFVFVGPPPRTRSRRGRQASRFYALADSLPPETAAYVDSLIAAEIQKAAQRNWEGIRWREVKTRPSAEIDSIVLGMMYNPEVPLRTRWAALVYWRPDAEPPSRNQRDPPFPQWNAWMHDLVRQYPIEDLRKTIRAVPYRVDLASQEKKKVQAWLATVTRDDWEEYLGALSFAATCGLEEALTERVRLLRGLIMDPNEPQSGPGAMMAGVGLLVTALTDGTPAEEMLPSQDLKDLIGACLDAVCSEQDWLRKRGPFRLAIPDSIVTWGKVGRHCDGVEIVDRGVLYVKFCMDPATPVRLDCFAAVREWEGLYVVFLNPCDLASARNKKRRRSEMCSTFLVAREDQRWHAVPFQPDFD